MDVNMQIVLSMCTQMWVILHMSFHKLYSNPEVF